MTDDLAQRRPSTSASRTFCGARSRQANTSQATGCHQRPRSSSASATSSARSACPRCGRQSPC